MKITMIHGQNHKGSTYHVSRLLAEKLGAADEITEFFLPGDLNHFCVGCYACIEADEACPFYTEKKVILDAVEMADLLIFTTPNYCLMPSAPMKAFIDLTYTYWMSHRPRAYMFHKKAAVISTTAGAGAGQAIKGITRTLFYWGVPYIKSYGISVQAMNWQGVSEKKRAKINKDISALAKKISRVKKTRVGIKTRFIFWMMSNMQKAGWSSSPTETEYWRANGWLDKKRPWNQ